MARKRDGKIIIKRIVESGHGGHHGGAWKVAYADFVTAMMAFFLMLWLLSTTDKAKLEGLAQYFTDPSSASRLPPGGEGGILRGTSVLEPSFIEQPPTSPFDMSPTPARGEQTESELADRVVEAFGPVGDTVADNMQTDSTGERVTETSARFEKVEKAIGESLDKHVELAGLKEQVQVTRTKEGLRIELLDKDGVPMFATGSDRLSKEAQALLQVVMAAISAGPDRLSIRGHTDSRPFADGARSDNWRLSADRANATRVALVQLGLSADRIAEVIGKASTEPHLPDRPDDPSNRRISILLMAEPGGSPVSR